MTDDRSGWLSRRQLAAYLGISDKTLRAALRAGTLPAGSVRLGASMVRWSRAEIDAAMAENRQPLAGAADLGEHIAKTGKPNEFH